jgi:hypothetical protein
MSLDRFIELFSQSYLFYYLGLDENCFYKINENWLIVFREKYDFTHIEKYQIQNWLGNRFEYKIEENRITFKNICLNYQKTIKRDLSNATDVVTNRHLS